MKNCPMGSLTAIITLLRVWEITKHKSNIFTISYILPNIAHKFRIPQVGKSG